LTQKKNNKGFLVYILIAGSIILALAYLINQSPNKTKEIDYGTFMGYFDNLQVEKYDLDLGTGKIKIKLKGKDEETTYKVPSVVLFKDELFNDNYNYRKEYNKANPGNPLQYNEEPVQDKSFILNMIPTLLLLGVMIFFFVYMMKQTGSGGKIGQFGKSNAKNHLNVGKKATFADVAGADEEKEELKEIVDFLKDSKKYNEIGARIPKGVLLLGPPGTGKTLLARAVAGEAGVPFFSISGSDFVEMFVGVGASRVRDLFEQAKKNAPAIIFIDEIDAVGRHRGAGLGGGHDEREQTLNQLLVEMDGFAGNEGVIVMAATNRRDILDPALLRPGRFDRQILVGYPDIKGREEILKVHTRNKPLAPDVDLKTVAKATVGFTGADLENLVNEAGLLAARKNRKAITKEDLDEAAIKVVVGPEKKSHVITEKERKLTAYHEGGHAICTYYCEENDKVHQVSIIPRGGAGGYTMSLPTDDKSFVSKNEMKNKIVVLLGGRVAEKLILDDISTGASNDLERATGIARSMVTRYGFSEKLGPVVYGQDEHEVFLGRDFNSNRNYSENVAAEIDSEIRSIIEDAYQVCEDILSEHIDQLHFIAKYLMKFDKIDGADFEKLMKGEMTEEVFKNAEEIKKETGEDIVKNLDVVITSDDDDKSSDKKDE
jgi:cell division protease FtsH